MIAAIHQPAYLPWLGYFDRIARADRFIFLDTVQFEKNSFTNRNRIKTANGPIWLTMPVKTKGHTAGTLQTLETADAGWVDKHLRSIELAYRKAPWFDAQFPRFEALWRNSGDHLADICAAQLDFWLKELAIATPVIRASSLEVDSRKSQLVLDLCQAAGATEYLSGPFGRDYLDLAAFADAGIQVDFHEFQHPVYPQLYGPFVPNLAVVDAWFNLGPETAALFRSKT